jgi:Leucine-rich repeat (LRR) protein
MTRLKLLALNNNELHFVANTAFRDLTGLEEMWLRNNRLVYIPRALPDNLHKLYMDSNKIRQIEDGLFTNQSK